MTEVCQTYEAVCVATTYFDIGSKIVIGVVTGFGGYFTWRQYNRAQDWRKKDLAAQVTARLSTDDELSLACQALDWGTGPLLIPSRYKSIMAKTPIDPDNPTPIESGELMEHSPELMARALTVQLSFNYKKQPAGLIYRYCFDKLFQHFSEIHRLTATGQIDIQDLESLRYPLRQIARYEYLPDFEGGSRIFHGFLNEKSFGYGRVIELGRLLNVSGWDFDDRPISPIP